jgi:hypothetical protein
MVVETLSPVRVPIEPVGQGDEGGETADEEGEAADAPE